MRPHLLIRLCIRWHKTFPSTKGVESMATRILIVDDHEMTRLGLRTALEPEEDLAVVGEAATAGEDAARGGGGGCAGAPRRGAAGQRVLDPTLAGRVMRRLAEVAARKAGLPGEELTGRE